jgi:hypothetical protein
MGSFDYETPSGILAPGEFSPMGTFDNGEEFPIEEGFSAGRWGIPRTGSIDSESSPIAPGRRRHNMEPSPLAGYMNGAMSPFEPPPLDSMMRSPMHHPTASNTGRYENEYPVETGSARKRKAGAVTVSDSRREPHSSRLEPGAKPKELWPASGAEPSSKVSPGGTPGSVSLQIGGAASVSNRKTIEGINNMMTHPRSDGAPPSSDRDEDSSYKARRGHFPPPPPTGSRPPYPPPPYASRMDMDTPIKYYPRPPHLAGQPYPFPPPGSSQKHMYPTASMKAEFRDGGLHKSMYPHQRPPEEQNESPGEKENSKKASGKRAPCNCKKSRCLKLYCDCFSAERFCDGCNCTDCQNTAETVAIRDKAMKDTRAKNPKAFQNRIEENHNVGCKCKKSECLKKYCEVC